MEIFEAFTKELEKEQNEIVRNQFAAAAITGLLANDKFPDLIGFSKQAFQIADLMIEAGRQ